MNHIDNRRFELNDTMKKKLQITLVVGAVLMALAFFFARDRFWINLLLNNFYFTSLALGGLFVMGIQAVSGAAWGSPYKRVALSMSTFLPVALVLMLVMLLGAHTLYEWSHVDLVASDPILSKKVAYLNMPFFTGRLIGLFLIWILFSWKLISLHNKQDETGDLLYYGKIMKFGALFLLIFAFSFSFASFDWIMSLEPHWFSTIFAVYTFSGLFVSTIAFLIFMIYMGQKMGYFSFITVDHYHDLGKFLLGFTTFWAYIWLSQFLLIWYSNIPEETQYFILRQGHGWQYALYGNVFINWVIPFFLLLPREKKRDKDFLFKVAALVLVGHWFDLYLMVAPKVLHHHGILHPAISWVEVGFFIFFFALFVMWVSRALSKRDLISNKDPMIDEALHLHQ